MLHLKQVAPGASRQRHGCTLHSNHLFEKQGYAIEEIARASNGSTYDATKATDDHLVHVMIVDVPNGDASAGDSTLQLAADEQASSSRSIVCLLAVHRRRS